MATPEVAAEKRELAGINADYKEKFGFHDPESGYAYKAPKGLSREVVESISEYKDEPQWMRDFRLKALDHFYSRPTPTWGGNLGQIDFDDIHYFVRASEKNSRDWSEVPEDIKNTFDRLGIPEAERKFLSGVGAQYECLAEETLVYTARGNVPIKDVGTGDVVFAFDESSERLRPAPVKATARKGRRQVYRVEVGNRTIRATANHPFLCLEYRQTEGQQRGRYRRRWKYLHDLREGDLVAVSKQLPDVGEPRDLRDKLKVRGTNLRDHPIRVPEQSNESLMWWLGLYIGDGFIHRGAGRKRRVEVAIPATERELQATLVESTGSLFGIEAKPSHDRVTVGATQLAELIEELGLGGKAHTKEVPGWVSRLPRRQRLAFIAGYVDADGYVRDHPKNKDVAITSGNRTMLEQVRQLALGCGLRCSRTTQFESRHPVDRRRAVAGHRLFISGDVSHLPLQNPRRRERVGGHRFTHDCSTAKGTTFRGHVNEDFGYVRIDAIKPDGEAEVYDIEVDGPHNFVAEGLIVHNSEVVYHQVNEKLEAQGVIFTDMDTALREHEDLVREYWATIIPPNDNKLAALNSAVWSGGSFVYVPAGVKVKMPLQAYFRINTENMGQFERTLIVCEEGADVHYIEGCHIAGSMVRVRDGERPIEQLEVGDEVLTHRGRFRRVNDVMRRPRRGPIRHIRFQNETYRSLAVTPGHPFLVAKRDRAREHNKRFDAKWLTAQELEKGDYVAMPVRIDVEAEAPTHHSEGIAVGRGRGTAVAEKVEASARRAGVPPDRPLPGRGIGSGQHVVPELRQCRARDRDP